MTDNSRSDSFTYWSFGFIYCAFIYFFSVFFLQQFILNSCSLSLVGNDWGSYINTAEIISNLDLVDVVAILQARWGNVDPGYWGLTYLLSNFTDSESYTPILNVSVVALSIVLARPLLNSFQLLIFTVFTTTSFSFLQSIILLPRQFCAYFIWQIAVYCFLVARDKNNRSNIILMILLAVSFHWSITFSLAMVLTPRLVGLLTRNRFKVGISSFLSIGIACAALFVAVRLNLAYKIFIYLSSNTENDLSRGIFSFFLPFFVLILLRKFTFTNFSPLYNHKMLQAKMIINHVLVSSFLLYVYFVLSQSLGISRITLTLYSILVPIAAFSFLVSSQNMRSIILSAYLFLFGSIEMYRISRIIEYISC